MTIPAGERDPNLPKRLEAEWPEILAWAIAGCLEWQRVGLQPPRVVVDATEKYLAEEDRFQAWIEECCEPDTRAWESSADLFASWSAWTSRNGEQPWDKKRFSQAREARGYEASKRREQRGHAGLKLIRASTDEAYWNR